MGIGPGTQTILASPYLTDEWEMPAEPVLLSGDGHWWIALDYRIRGRDGEPSVVWYDNELGEDVQVAATFRAFAEGLAARPAPPARRHALAGACLALCWIPLFPQGLVPAISAPGTRRRLNSCCRSES
jgi:hypothetical protein